MIRLRWFDRESDASSAVNWTDAAAVLATLFLNILVWMQFSFWQFYPLPRFSALLAGVALVATALFFIGPMLLAHGSRRPLFGVIEDSFGLIPMLVLRGCAAVFLLFWIGHLTSTLQFWGSRFFPEPVGVLAEGAISAAFLLLLLATGVQGLRTQARLASFTIRLALAVLIAAFLRVPDGWYAIPDGFSLAGDRSACRETWQGFSQLAWYAAPLGVFAADFGYRIARRRDVAALGLVGVALPLFGSLLIPAAIGVAVGHSDMYQPSLMPDVAMALWAHAAHEGLPPRFLIAAVTVFGALRFGIGALGRSASIRNPLLLGLLLIAAVVVSVWPYYLRSVSDAATRCMVATGAVLTANWLLKRRAAAEPRWVDWGGCLALAAGFATPAYYLYWAPSLTEAPGGRPWVILSYLVALGAAVVIRGVQWTLALLFLRAGLCVSASKRSLRYLQHPLR